MLPLIPTTSTHEFATTLARATSMRDPDDLFRDEQLQPDPGYITLRMGVTALRDLFTRSQELEPIAKDCIPVQPIASIAPIASDEDAPRIAA